ncbi:MAG: nucleotidyltransferase domain-containing protein [Magnetococcus sp. YQC-3]
MKVPDPYILQEMVQRIIDAAHPLRIVLFGSAARGEMGPDSDVDLLVVMPDGIHRRQTWQVVFRALRGIGVAKDIIVVTQRDIIDYGHEPSLVIAPALAEGRELYCATE